MVGMPRRGSVIPTYYIPRGMGTQFTIYLDEMTTKKLKELPFGNSRSDKIRYCIRQMDPTTAAMTDSLLLFKNNIDRFFSKYPETYEEFNQFCFVDVHVEVKE
jgi:hypothetical protein